MVSHCCTSDRSDSAAGRGKEFVFMLGYCENPADDKWEAPGIINKTSAKALIERFNTMEKAMQAFAELKNYWETLLARFAVVSENEHIDRMANIWNQYQCMVTFNMSRSASYYESGTDGDGVSRFLSGSSGICASYPGAGKGKDY